MDDLDHVIVNAEGALRSLDGAQILITGASGFLGSWMAESLAFASHRLNLKIRAFLLVRNPDRFTTAFPHLVGHPAVTVLPGSLHDFALDGIDVTHVVHAAAPVVHGRIPDDPFAAFDAIVSGTRRLLEISRASGAQRLLNISSGAIYGTQPPGLERIPEDFSGGPDPLSPVSVYGESKRAAELLCALSASRGELETIVARGFSFIGPRLPVNRSYAAGDFLADGMAGGPINVTGDGTPWRSFMHAADATFWMWTMLVKGVSGRAYNLGSDDPCTILQLAQEIGSLWRPNIEVVRHREPDLTLAPSRYVPSVQRAQTEMDLTVRISRREGLRRALDFTRGRQ